MFEQGENLGKRVLLKIDYVSNGKTARGEFRKIHYVSEKIVISAAEAQNIEML